MSKKFKKIQASKVMNKKDKIINKITLSLKNNKKMK